MNEAYYNFVAAAGAAEISHVGLVDELGDEITGGSYERQTVSWTTPSGGLIRPTENRVFDIPGGNTVAGWRGYNALTDGDEYGGEDLPNEPYTGDGQYTLNAAQTGIRHEEPAA